jgi:1-acyl-sn-glycerol-3-phosphate acyltransferase
MLRRFSWLVSIFGRVEVSGSIPEELRRGPLLLAANHIGDFDPFVVAVALARLGVTPRIMATGGIIAAPVAGPLLERTGGIRVERGTEVARHAVRVTEVALVHGGHVVAYPEGRVGLAPDAWPERGRTGMARLALGVGVPVLPVSQWGAHEVLQYGNDWGKLRTLLRSVVRRPVLRVHVGPPVKLDDLQLGRVGDANRARTRIAAALTRGLVPLRAADTRGWVDPTRPTTGQAAFPGGVVPEDVP